MVEMHIPGTLVGSKTGRMAFCASARTGLGHLRRIGNIAGQIRRIAPQIELVLITNAPPAALDDDELAHCFAHSLQAERCDMARTAAMLDADAVVVDTAVLPDLELLPQTLALVLRETVEERVGAFRLPAGRLWDLVLVAEPSERWTVSPSAIGAARVENVGWIYRQPVGGLTPFERCDNQKIVLVAAGGGGAAAGADALKAEIETVLDRVLEGAAQRPLVLQVLGPRAQASARLRNADAQIDVGAHLNAAFAAADVVVSTSGYNSVLELAATTTPAVLVSVPRTYDDQSARAESWGEAIGLPHRSGDPLRTARWMTHVLNAGYRRNPAILERSGDLTAAHALVELMGQARAHARPGVFAKTDRTGRSSIVAALARRLFVAGVTTPAAMALRSPGTLGYASLAGPTAQELWSACGAADGHAAGGHAALIERIAAAALSLHRSQVVDDAIVPLDAWAKIRPRMAVGCDAVAGLGAARGRRMFKAAAQLADRHANASERNRTVLVHGDFHLRQLIAPIGRPDLAVVDLDDVAYGPAEFDLANFAAHVATTPGLGAGSVTEVACGLARIMSNAYVAQGGRPLDRAEMLHLLALSLLRRLLKLAETGRPELSEDILAAIESILSDAGAARTKRRAVVSRLFPPGADTPRVDLEIRNPAE